MTDHVNDPTIQKMLDGIAPLDAKALEAAQRHMDSLVKPLGSLGKLEEIAVRMAGITGEIHNNPEKRAIVIMAADNGICAEGVASTPQEITLLQTINMTRGICGIGVLSKWAGADLRVVDIGINSDYKSEEIIDAKIMPGTDNFAKGPAMSRAQAEAAIKVGIKIIADLSEEGYGLIGTGEMGIGNTSSSSAVIMALTGTPASDAVGKGGGLTEEAYEKKKLILENALKLHSPNPEDPVDVLAKVGGLDIAGLVGCYIGAAYYRIPIVVDGVISIAAALAASRLHKGVREFMIPSHISMEPAYKAAERELRLSPMLALDMRLGEGTGCPLAFQIIDAACAIMNHMATFEEVSIDKDYRVDNRK